MQHNTTPNETDSPHTAILVERTFVLHPVFFCIMDQAITLFFNGSSSLYLDSIAWNATQMFVWIPFLLVVAYVVFREHDFPRMLFLIGGTLLCVLLCDQVASTICKPLIARWRPTHNPYLQDAVDIVNGYRGGPYGFFSSHAANTFAVASFLAPVFRRRAITLSLFGWALLSCWTRVYLGVHYVGDLVTGLLFGLFIGTIAHRLYRHYFSQSPTLTYHSQHLELIPRAFAITLCLVTIPWKLYF